MNKKVLYSALGVVVFFVIAGALILSSTAYMSASQRATTMQDIAERKKELGLDYTIVVDRTPKMSRPGRNFSAVFSPATPKPTARQMEALGEVVRDEYQMEQFLWLTFWDDAKAAAEDLSKYKNVDAGTAEGDAEWEIVQSVQNHMIMQYNKNDATGLNQLEIYPNGLQATESKDIVKVNY